MPHAELILHAILAMTGTYAVCALIRASNDLCRRAERDYHNPNDTEGDDDAPER